MTREGTGGIGRSAALARAVEGEAVGDGNVAEVGRLSHVGGEGGSGDGRRGVGEVGTARAVATGCRRTALVAETWELSLTAEETNATESEIGELEVTFRVDEEVVGLEIAVEGGRVSGR